MSFKQRFIVAHADHNCFLNLLSDVDNVGCFASAKHAMGNGNGNGNVNGNGNGISLFNKKNSTLLKLETNSGLKEEGCDQYCLYYKMRHYRKYYLGEYLISTISTSSAHLFMFLFALRDTSPVVRRVARAEKYDNK